MLGALVVLAAAQDAPKSILPEGVFGAPSPTRVSPVERPTVAPASSDPSTAPAPVPPNPAGEAKASPASDHRVPGLPNPGPGTASQTPGTPAPGLTALDSAAPAVSLDSTGLLGPADGGYGPGTFAGSDGRFLAALMGRIQAPLASRWVHIILVRALASTVPAPAPLRPADWVAARVSLLMRLGEADVAHALAERVPVDRYTPLLYQASFDASLAAADPAALCPIALTGQSLSGRVVWKLATAMCAGIMGDEIGAANAFETVRTSPGVEAFDITLAERIAASAGAGTRTANVEWGEAETINLYRLGLGLASGAPLPDRFVNTLPPPAMGWLFRAASAPAATRAAAALPAAAQGIVGSGELAAFYASLAGDPEAGGVGAETASRLRAAYAGAPADRMAAMRALWNGATADADRYGALVLTAGAAINVRPDRHFAHDAPDIMASALAGGRADLALRWWPIADAEGGDIRARAWALAAVAGGTPASADRFDAWLRVARADDAARADHRARLLLAALAGPGRGGALDGARRAMNMVPLADAWTGAIDRAAAAGNEGEVIVLAATGMQSGFADLPPAHLEHILAALDRVGRGAEARLIAAEALARG